MHGAGPHERADGRVSESETAVDKLADDLAAPRPETRRSAVKKLGAIGSRAALDLVLGALADRDGQVADEAEIVLARAADARAVQLLAGRSGLGAREPLVRERAAGVLGRVAHEVEARPLLLAVDSSAHDVARAALAAIERQARARRLVGEVRAIARALAACTEMATLAPPARGAALTALAAVDGAAAHDRALELLEAREPALRCAALVVARSFTEVEGTRVASAALFDPDLGVRLGAILALETWTSRAAVLALIEHLEREERSRPRFEILRHLRATSGADHGFDLAAWRAWAATIQGRWSTGGAAAPGAPLGDTHVALAGLTLLSDRVAFLIDLSGSMWQTQVGDKTRKEWVDERVRAALEALPRTAEFNVIPYTGEPFPWEKRLVRANGSNVERAVQAFERCHRSGPGDVWDAIEVALEDPDVDTICVLTDGVPTGGARWNLELLVELVVERNRCRNVAFDSILVDAPKPHRRAWAALAAATGGRSISIELGAAERADARPKGGSPKAGKGGADPPK